MTSSESFYSDKTSNIKTKIRKFEQKKLKERRAKLALDVFRLKQRKVKKDLILDRFGLTEISYDKLLKEGKEQYEKLKT